MGGDAIEIKIVVSSKKVMKAKRLNSVTKIAGSI